jgi:hypothetical protein
MTAEQQQRQQRKCSLHSVKYFFRSRIVGIETLRDMCINDTIIRADFI